MEYVQNADFWLALIKITGINILLAGDTAVVIALVSRGLPPVPRRAAVLGGSLGAVALRVLFCLIAVSLLPIAFLPLAGGLLLLWIGVQLMVPERGGGKLGARSTLWGVLLATVIADAVMSLGTAVAIVATAKGDTLLILLGLLISVPVLIFGSALVLHVVPRFPWLVTVGTGLLGWIGGGLVVGDPGLRQWLRVDAQLLDIVGKLLGSVLVMTVGTVLARRGVLRPRDIVDLAPEDRQ